MQGELERAINTQSEILKQIYEMLRSNMPTPDDQRILGNFHLNVGASTVLTVTFTVPNEWHITGIQLTNGYYPESWTDDQGAPVTYTRNTWETYYQISTESQEIWANWFPPKKIGDPYPCFVPPIIARKNVVVTITNADGVNAHLYDCIIEGFQRVSTQDNKYYDPKRNIKLERRITHALPIQEAPRLKLPR